jgi:hypothetical protein
MNRIAKICLALSFLGLSACNNSTLDASSSEALEASLTSVYARLPLDESNRLKASMDAINSYFQTRVYKGEGVEDAQREYLAMLNGKSPKEINEEAMRLAPFAGARIAQ